MFYDMYASTHFPDCNKLCKRLFQKKRQIQRLGLVINLYKGNNDWTFYCCCYPVVVKGYSSGCRNPASETTTYNTILNTA
jgi:hypothetical protein